MKRDAAGSLHGRYENQNTDSHADDLNARNLYVAMTRGSRQIVVCSRSPLLNPAL